MEGITNEEEEIFLVAKLDLFIIKTITLLKSKILSATIFGAKIGTENLMFNFPHSKGQI
jgi:hypothetical protein